MRRTSVFVACVVAAVGVRAQPPAPHPVSIPDLLSLRQVVSPAVAPDGRMVIYAVRAWENGTGRDSQRKESRTHVWRVGTDGRGARQLTFSERGETAPAWSPDGQTISFLSARETGGASSGGETDGPIAQIWTMPADGGEARRLTDSRESIAAYAWAPDGRSIAYVARDPLPKELDEKHKRRDDAQVYEGDFRQAHLFMVDVASKNSVEVYHDPAATVRGEPSWSADSARVAVAAAPTTMARDARSDVYVVTVASKTAEKITTNAGPDADPAWSPDGATIAYLAQPNAAKPLADGTFPSVVGNEHLMLYDVRTKQAKDAARPDFDLSPGSLHWAADSRSILFTSGIRTARDLFSFDVATGKYTQASRGRIATLSDVTAHGLALVAESSSAPAEVYFAESAQAEPRKLTDTNPEARSFALGRSEVISWKSDGFTIEGVLLKPVNFEEGRKYPLLVVAHGGPSGAYVDNYRVGYGDGSQNWAGEGWAVLYPNPRGSTNYGEKFEQANIRDWGGGDYRDIMSGVDAVVARGIADPDRLAFMGWSYGGYMTCWVVSQTTRFKAAMMGAGLTDLPSMYGTNDIPNVLVPYFGGTLSKETMPLYTERSGITYVDRVTTPLLILQGGSDQRVPIGQPMELYRALKDRGKTAELVFFPREGHGFSEYYHQLDRLQRQHDWIVRYTLGAGGKKTSSQ
ncbi:MAG TPA: S9 family peptidase [Vicinamibacterales bacterium]|jgi:dipeptidyl aminopeptidase/acylaminoacyl peptidase|nr:S9 family peptidase [Vicinamibacterales bacterium]